MVPAKLLARRRDFFGAKRRSMRRRGALFVRRAETDDRAAGDERRFIGDGYARRLGRGIGDGGGIMPVDGIDMPATGAETRLNIFGEGKVGRSVDRNFIVVKVENDQPPKLGGAPRGEQASWLMPSMKSPSEAMTKVR